MSVTTITTEAIEGAERLIRPHIRRTPAIEMCDSDFRLNRGALIFKLELCQHGGSFKTRGAFANLLTRAIPPVGVVAASGGNHGAAVAYAAWKLGPPARIFVPTVSSASKVDKIRSFGAALVVIGDRYADALTASEQWAEQSGALRIHAFDQLETLLGQGTLGMEAISRTPRLTHWAPPLAVEDSSAALLHGLRIELREGP